MMKLNNSGFTLIEVVISLGVLAFGIVGLFTMQTMGIIGNRSANVMTESVTWAADKVEEIVGLDYADLTDLDGNGSDEDSNRDGVDDNGGNFGLDDTITGVLPDADYSELDVEGKYDIFWNVAVDYPFLGVKTVQINVVEKTSNKVVKIQYQKFDQI